MFPFFKKQEATETPSDIRDQMEYYSAKSSSQNGNHEIKLLFPFLIIKLYALLCPLGLISLTAVSDKKCVHEKSQYTVYYYIFLLSLTMATGI